MLLNRFPLNSGAIGSGAPINFVTAAANQIVTAVGGARATMVAYAKATCSAVAAGTAHSRVVFHVKISGAAAAVGSFTSHIAVNAFGAAAQVVSATGSVLAHVYRTVTASTSAVMRVIGSVYGRYAVRGVVIGTASVSGVARFGLTQHASATQICRVECIGHLPWDPAPDERSFALIAGDRVFFLPKD